MLVKSDFQKSVKTESVYDFRDKDEIDRWVEKLGRKVLSKMFLYYPHCYALGIVFGYVVIKAQKD